MAMVPLRQAGSDAAFGLLVVGSPDPTRYSADMGTDFLVSASARSPAPGCRGCCRARDRRAEAAAPLPAELLRYLQHLEVERRLAARTLAMYREALQRLASCRRRGRCRAAGGAVAPCAALDRAAAPARPRAAQPGDRAGGLARPVPLVGRTARGGAATRSTACARRRPPSRCPRRCRSTTRWRWPDMWSQHGDPALVARDHAIVELLYGSGLRVGELVGLDAARWARRRRLDRRRPTPPRMCSARAASGAACRWAAPR